MALTLAIGNQKGGVGKTALVTGLTDALRNRGKTVLVVDADPQANATAIMDIAGPQFTLNDVLFSVKTPQDTGKAAGAIISAGEGWDGIDILPSERKLAEREKDDDIGRETRLRTALAGVSEDYDFVLIDSPPSLGALTANALVAADEVLAVAQPRKTAVEGLAQFVTTLANVRAYFNPTLTIAGIVVNQFRSGRTDPEYWLDVLVEEYGELVLQPKGLIPDREIVSQAAAAQLPVSAFGSKAVDVWVPLKHIADLMIARAEARQAGAAEGVMARG
ncbi:ParA family protein [Georgenia daeguensis]|uniref:ParA family protein n=1 Tax=Georgenia daeguensis TaxID=908355 RepID=A0ABP6UPA3_9MICO